ncbi:MAG: hypothetical protein HYZ74_09340 [Elusimicrobia bacterium]|nr:hypothetical protein [Elusimicrobiota bacterium]
MKRARALLLAFVYGLSSIGAQAGAMAKISIFPADLAAPTPTLIGAAPAAHAASALPLAALLPASGLVNSPLRPIPGSAAAVPIEPGATAARATIDMLREMAGPAALRRSSPFDGAALKPDDASDPPRLSPQPAAETPLKKAKRPLYNTFLIGLNSAMLTAATAPVLWSAAPAHKFLYTLNAVVLLFLAIAVPIDIGLRIRHRLHLAAQKPSPAPSLRRTLSALMLGLVLGGAIGSMPTVYEGPIVQRFHAWQDSNRMPQNRVDTRWVSGGIVEDETIKTLSANPIGRQVLDELRDRGGVIRMPTFYVSKMPVTKYADNSSRFDAIYISQHEIEKRGWTVDEFMANPTFQRRLIREMQVAILHELVHSGQNRSAPWTPGYFTYSLESEYEAYLKEHYYVFELLKADPKRHLFSDEELILRSPAANLSSYLTSLGDSYQKNIHVASPAMDAYLAKVRSDMPTHRVEVFVLLSENARLQQSPSQAAIYMRQARAAAKEAGLPPPTLHTRPTQ